MRKIKVVDSLPGSGKTFAQFNYMKKHPEDKWMFVTTRLDEIDRIKGDVVGEKGCPELNFHSPLDTKQSKNNDALRLIESGLNIACTHSLFDKFTEEHIAALKRQQYHVVFDEEYETVEPCGIPIGDVRSMERTGQIEVVGKEQRVVLLHAYDEYTDPTSNSKKVADAAVKGTLYCGIHNGKITYLVSQIPIELIKAAKSVTILTHNFKGSMFDSFLKIHDLDWEYFHLPLRFTDKEIKDSLKTLINFPEVPRTFKKLEKYDLTHTFLETTAADRQLKEVGKGILSIYGLYPDASKVMFTTRKDNSERNSRRSIFRKKDRNISGNYVAFNARATNLHAHMNVVIHAIERVPNPKLTGYFKSHKCDFSEDHFALSELVQFIFRSAVRNGKPIDLYIASPRMKRLFVDWLNDEQEPQLLEDYA